MVVCDGPPGASLHLLFPLPAVEQFRAGMSAQRDANGGGPVEEKRLKWKLEELGFTQFSLPLPAPLRSAKRRETPSAEAREWSSAEAAVFGDCLARHGRRFRDMLPELPGRTVADLVEAYYRTHKTHNHINKIDTHQQTRNVREGMCCTVGCLLHHNHGGLHLFEQPVGPRVRRQKVIQDAVFS
ncbi:hypothetical protein EMIHUDRAFT_228762 [Emiliania huxleyi CCMP1516]|uniref:SANT domain-containing protein n=2 Tax=Emiliania huxleyi TaxID=2903 RepID=A0A0D3KED9_EMIH1|nr:hypothetical protein EMIHUDRAFT_228762 [Emiliania huxleyi CCMP1516]EOD34124.1 hypothetical protein EMIHUDRAFT_228762 [Emiliania huxleyi CCMP1516]|eukprot:XP_005786553.1 hypothetical protein EMIHUDRAFT_228762 [Emiliania huxleyi CCMP1516]